MPFKCGKLGNIDFAGTWYPSQAKFRLIDFSESESTYSHHKDILAYSDTLGNGQECQYEQGVTVNSPIEAQKEACQCNRCHCKRGSL